MKEVEGVHDAGGLFKILQLKCYLQFTIRYGEHSSDQGTGKKINLYSKIQKNRAKECLNE